MILNKLTQCILDHICQVYRLDILYLFTFYKDYGLHQSFYSRCDCQDGKLTM